MAGRYFPWGLKPILSPDAYSRDREVEEENQRPEALKARAGAHSYNSF